MYIYVLVGIATGATAIGGTTGTCAVDYAGRATVCSCGQSNGVCEGTYDGAHLALVNQQLAGTVPRQLAKLTHITGIWLDHNSLTGTIPRDLAKLSDLTVLSLRDNRLTGTIPTELGRLTKLTTLRLEDNLLTGSFPSQLAALTSLTNLNLDYTYIEGAPGNPRDEKVVCWPGTDQPCAEPTANDG